MKSNRKYWQRVAVPSMAQGGNFWSANISEAWKFLNPGKLAMSIMIDYLPETKFGKIRHMTIKKVDLQAIAKFGISKILNSEEPTYGEKLSVLNHCGKWKKIALEIFPVKQKLVDSANLYHIWELEDKSYFPFSINEIFEEPDSFKEQICLKGCNIEYASKISKCSTSSISYLYLRRVDGEKLTWYQKQLAKDDIYSDDITAVEIIVNSSIRRNYSCLICLPYDFNLGFGLAD